MPTNQIPLSSPDALRKYRTTPSSCSCPDALHRAGGSFSLAGRRACKHQVILAREISLYKTTLIAHLFNRPCCGCYEFESGADSCEHIDALQMEQAQQAEKARLAEEDPFACFAGGGDW